jgi:hypothetical protein
MNIRILPGGRFNIGSTINIGINGARRDIPVGPIVTVSDEELQLIKDTGATFTYGDTVLETDEVVAAINSVLAGGLPSVVTFGDPNFAVSLNGGTLPYLVFDSADAINYDRAANKYIFNIDNLTRLVLDASGLSVPDKLTVGDANFRLGKFSTYTEVLFDAGDALDYDRVGNNFLFYVANSIVANLNASQFSLASGMAFNASYVNVSGVLQAGDANFNLAVVGANAIVTVDAGDAFYYNRTGNTFAWQIGGVNRMTLDTTGAIFAGTVACGDVNFQMNFNSGTQPLLAFDNGDNLSYIRSTNAFVFNIGNTSILDIFANKLFVNLSALPIYADNAAATAGGLNPGDVYRTATGQWMSRF